MYQNFIIDYEGASLCGSKISVYFTFFSGGLQSPRNCLEANVDQQKPERIFIYYFIYYYKYKTPKQIFYY